MICPTCTTNFEEKHDVESIANNGECIACMLKTIDAQIKKMRKAASPSPPDTQRVSTSA